MRRNLLFAALALVLLCSLAGCKTNTTAAHVDRDNMGLASSERSALQYNGVHDGSGLVGRNGRIVGYQNNYTYSALDGKEYNTLGEDLRIAGEKVADGIEDTAEGITRGVENTAIGARTAAENTARNIHNGVMGTRAG